MTFDRIERLFKNKAPTFPVIIKCDQESNSRLNLWLNDITVHARIKCQSLIDPSFILVQMAANLFGLPREEAKYYYNQARFTELIHERKSTLSSSSISIILEKCEYLFDVDPSILWFCVNMNDIILCPNVKIIFILTTERDPSELQSIFPLPRPIIVDLCANVSGESLKSETLNGLTHLPIDKKSLSCIIEHVYNLSHRQISNSNMMKTFLLKIIPVMLEVSENKGIPINNISKIYGLCLKQISSLVNGEFLRAITSIQISNYSLTARYLILSAFIASNLHPKHDSRIFGDSKKRSRSMAAGVKKGTNSFTIDKSLVSQPRIIILDRLMAIYYFIASSPVASIQKVVLTITSLCNEGLLQRITVPNKLDLVKYRCRISADMVAQCDICMNCHGRREYSERPFPFEGCSRNFYEEEYLQQNLYCDKVPLPIYNQPSPVMAAEFSRQSPNHLLIGNEGGDLILVDSEKVSYDGLNLNSIQQFTDPVLDLSVGRHNFVYAAAVGDNTCYVGDLNEGSQSPTITLKNSQQTNTKSIRFQPNSGDNMIMTATREGIVAFWDLRQTSGNSKGVAEFETCHSLDHSSHNKSNIGKRKKTLSNSSSITMAEFHPSIECLIATIGQPDYSIKFWDTRMIRKNSTTNRPSHCDLIAAPNNGRRQRAFISLCWNSSGSDLFATSSDNNIYQYLFSNMSSDPVDIYNHSQFRTSGSFYIRSIISPNDNFILSGSTEGCAFIWSTERHRNGGRRAFKLSEQRFEVSTVAWSQKNNIFLGGEDHVSRIWKYLPNEGVSIDPILHIRPEVLCHEMSTSVQKSLNNTKIVPVELRLATRQRPWPKFELCRPQSNAVTFTIPCRPIQPSNDAPPTLPKTPSSARKRQLSLDGFLKSPR